MCHCSNRTNPNPARCICGLCQQLSGIVQPYFLGKYYEKGDKAVSDNTLYVCTEPHQASPTVFIGDPLYWVADYGDLPMPEPTKAKTKATKTESESN